MDDILISVIVPVYNTKEYLPRCVSSICAQTYRCLEILLVDDGSTDGSGELCEVLALKDPRIRVIHKENGGSSSARNEGIVAAEGKYLGFVDSDDYLEPQMYEKLLDAINTYDLQIAQAGRNEIDAQGNALPGICIPPTESVAVSSELFFRELLMHRGDCSFCTKLIDASLLQTDKFPEGILNEDFNLLIRLLDHIEGIVSIPYIGYHVCYRLGSNTRRVDLNDFSRVFSDNVNNADFATLIVDKYFPNLHREVIRFGLFQRMDYLLHVPISKMNYDNRQYVAILKYLRHHFKEMVKSPYLTKKNKLYLFLFTVMPVRTRKIHASVRLRGSKSEK